MRKDYIFYVNGWEKQPKECQQLDQFNDRTCRCKYIHGRNYLNILFTFTYAQNKKLVMEGYSFMSNKNFAAIFDMDGVIIDNALYHEKAWKIFLKRSGINLSEKDFKEIVFGRTGNDVLRILFKDITESEIIEHAKEINATYRDEYAPFIQATPGLLDFLKLLKHNNITAAIATSAPPINVEYIVEKLDIREYFANTIDDTQVTKGKPDPEIYLASADAINYKPSQCVVFEDSLAGI